MLFQDVRNALRALGRAPGFAAAALVTLALGIGANTAVFSVVHGVLLRSLPYGAPDELLAIWAGRFLSYQDVLYLQEHARGVTDVAGLSPGWGVAMTGVGEPAQLTATKTTANLFDTLRVAPLLGRTFRPEDVAPGAPRVAVLAHRLWRTRFAGGADVLGRTIVLDGEPFSVVGVMPSGFETIEPETDLWLPLPLDSRQWYFSSTVMLAIGRLAEGSTFTSVGQEVPALARGLRERFGYPDDYGQGATVVPLRDQLVGPVRTTLVVLAGGVGFILLIACANIASLLLGRATGRMREVAVRAALGAGRVRLVRQLLTESAVLALLGGVAGIALAAYAMPALTRLLPADMPRLDEVSINVDVLGVALVVSLFSGLLFGTAPALVASRADLQGILRGTTVAGASPSGRRLRGALVAGEIALALVLAVGASLMLQTLWRLHQVDLGFQPDGVLTLRVQPTGPRYQTIAQVTDFFDRVFERIQSMPGVRSVGAIQHLPLSHVSWTTAVEIEGRPLTAGASPPRVGWRIVTRDYFATLGIPVIEGRGFTHDDTARAPAAVVINRAMAEELWPGESPLGRRVRDASKEWSTIVGVVGNVHHDAVDRTPGPELYHVEDQTGHTGMAIAVRTAGDPLGLARPVREAIWSIDPNVPVSEVRTMHDIVGRALATPRLLMTLLALFAGVGLALAVVGIYGVVAYAVSQRTHEIGVRIALGASPGRVAAAVVRQGVWLSLIGVAIGTAAALALARTMTTVVFGVSPTDPATLAILCTVLVGVAVAASYLPARRAAGIDPADTLRAAQ